MSKNYHTAVLPGDSIGPEVMVQALKVLDTVHNRLAMRITINRYDVGDAAVGNRGQSLPPATVEGYGQADAVLFGSVGGPRQEHLPPGQQPERGALLPLRKHFRLFSNLRPAKLYQGLEAFCPLCTDTAASGFDILHVCELTGDAYFGQSRDREDSGQCEEAFGTGVHHHFRIERTARIVLESTRKHRHKVTSIGKTNVLQSSTLWREIVNKITTEYPDVELTYIYTDNVAVQLIKDPSQFDVLLCSNPSGDTLSDEYVMITGSMGMLPFASLDEQGFGLYEPTGGSAPDIAGKSIANPIAQILSLALLLCYNLGADDAASATERATNHALGEGIRIEDLTRSTAAVSTDKMGDIIARYVAEGV